MPTCLIVVPQKLGLKLTSDHPEGVFLPARPRFCGQSTVSHAPPLSIAPLAFGVCVTAIFNLSDPTMDMLTPDAIPAGQ